MAEIGYFLYAKKADMVDQSTEWIAHLGPGADAANVMSSLRNRLTGVPPSSRDPITPP